MVSLAQPNGAVRTHKGGSRGGTKPAAGNDRRITTCKLCRFGVYDGDDKVWGTGVGAPIGWSHTGCAEAVSGGG